MKKMNVKKALVATLAVATLGVAASGAAIISAPETVSAASAKPTPTTFEMVEGASVRTVADAGIRFSTYLNKAWIDSQTGTVEVGTLVIPNSKLTDTTDANFNVATADVLTYTHDKATTWLVDGDYYKVNAVLSEIPDVELATTLAAKSYVKVDGEVIDYADPQTRSIAQVASKAIADGDEAGYLTTVLDKTVEDISVSFEGAQEGVEGFRLLNGAEKTLTVSGTFAEGLKETPNLADYAVLWESSDETAVSVENGKVTSLGGEATVTAKLGSSTASTPVRLNVKAEKTFTESKFYNKNSSSTDKLVSMILLNGGTLAKNSDTAYVKEGDSSWTWSPKAPTTASGKLTSYAGLRFTCCANVKSDVHLDQIFADSTVTSFSFDVYNAYDTDIAYGIGHNIHSTTPTIAAAAITRISGTLYTGTWTTVTITREKYEQIITDMGTAATASDERFAFKIEQPSAGTLYIDNFKIATDAIVDGGFESHFYLKGKTETLVTGTLGSLSSSNVTVNTDATYVKEGSSSWKCAIGTMESTYPALNFLCCANIKNEVQLDQIFADTTVESFSFDVYNAYDADITYAIGRMLHSTSTPGEVRASGTLTKGTWTTVTITRAVYEQVMADLVTASENTESASRFVLKFVVETAGTIYIDNFVVG